MSVTTGVAYTCSNLSPQSSFNSQLFPLLSGNRGSTRKRSCTDVDFQFSNTSDVFNSRSPNSLPSRIHFEDSSVDEGVNNFNIFEDISTTNVSNSTSSDKQINCASNNCLVSLRDDGFARPSLTPRILVCSFPSCGYSTLRESWLKTHVRKHTGERPYGCPHCEFRSAQKSNLTVHVKKVHKDMFDWDQL